MSIPAAGGIEGPRRRLLWLAALALVCVGIAVAYSNSLRNGFHLDDLWGITPNPYVRSLRFVPRYFVDPATYNTHAENVDYRPMVSVTYALNYALSGYEPWSWHLLNLGLHGVVCLSVFGLGRALLGTGRVAPVPWVRERDGDLAALAAAVLFTVHPVGSGCANYMWARSSLLVAAFVLPASVLYLRAIQHRSGWRTGLATLLFACGLFTKPEAIAFLGVAGLAELLLEPSRREEGLLGRARPRVSDLRLAPLLAVAAGYLAARGVLLPHDQGRNWASSSVDQWQYLLTQTGAWWYYIGKLVAPVNLVADYAGYIPWLSLSRPGAFLSVMEWGAGAALLLACAGRAPAVLLLGASYLIYLSPTSSIVPLAEMVNEHRPYLPVTGLFLLGAAGAVVLVGAVLRWARAEAALAGPCVVAGALGASVALGLLTRERNRVFLDELTYWRDVAEKDPRSGRAQLNYGMELWRRGELDEAERRIRESVRLWPAWHFGYINLGLLRSQRGRVDEARAALDKAVAVRSESSIPWYYRGQFRLDHGDASGAADDLERAVALASVKTRERAAYARALLAVGREEEAAAQIDAGRTVDPGEFAGVAQALVDRGVDRLAHRQYAAAERCFTLAAEVRPGFALPLINLGVLRHEQGRAGESRAFFDGAVAAEPGAFHPYAWRGTYREGGGDLAGAIEDYRKAAELNPRGARELVTLAEALLKSGRVGEAREVIGRGEAIDAGAFALLRARLEGVR